MSHITAIIDTFRVNLACDTGILRKTNSRFKLPHISDIYKTVVVATFDITTIKQALSQPFRDKLQLGDYRKTDLATRQCNKVGSVRMKVTMRHAQITIVTVEKQYLRCVSVALVIYQAKCMCRIVKPHAACPALPHVSHYLINGTIFGRKLLNIQCVLILPTTFVRNISF